MPIRAVATSLTALCALALAGALAHPPPVEASHGCWARPSTTVVRSSEARVFRKRVYLTSRETDGAAGYRLVDYGCHYGKRATYRLPQLGEFGITAIPRAPLALSGRFVGYVQRFSSAASGENVEVTVRNLVTGRVLRRFSGSESNSDSSLPVFDLVVKRNGSAAWISEDRETENQVHVADVSGQRRIVDRGAGIEPRSLELTPDRRAIVYTKDAERRALPLD